MVLFGILAGAAAATKLTGWLLPVPLLFWTVLYRERKGALALALGLVVAALTVYAVTPPWWFAPWQGLTKFLRSNLTRGESTPIPVQFLGTVYLSPNESLPWYNTLVWTVAASPIGFLAWALAGVSRAVRNRADRFAIARRTMLGFSPRSESPSAHARPRRRPPNTAGIWSRWHWWPASGSAPGQVYFEMPGVGRHPGRSNIDRRHDARPPFLFQSGGRRLARSGRSALSRRITGTP